jgi:hypothetical protein
LQTAARDAAQTSFEPLRESRPSALGSRTLRRLHLLHFRGLLLQLPTQIGDQLVALIDLGARNLAFMTGVTELLFE